MPRIAMATTTVDDEAGTTRVDDLIQRGRSQGHLSLAELRTAFDQAGLTPAEGRSILRELSEAGVRLANELDQAGSKSRPKRSAAEKAKPGPARTAKTAASTQAANSQTASTQAASPQTAPEAAGANDGDLADAEV